MPYICGLCDKPITEIVDPTNLCPCEEPFLYNNFKGCPEKSKKANWALAIFREEQDKKMFAKWGMAWSSEHLRRGQVEVLCDYDCDQCARKGNLMAPRRSPRLSKRTVKDFKEDVYDYIEKVRQVCLDNVGSDGEVLDEALDKLLDELRG